MRKKVLTTLIVASLLAITAQAQTARFRLKNSASTDTIWIDDAGNLTCTGHFSTQGSTQSGIKGCKVYSSSGAVLATMNSETGDVCVVGACYPNSGSFPVSKRFVIRDNSGNVVACIDDSGTLYLKGSSPIPPDVQFSLESLGNGQIRIGYSVTNGNAPRSIAFSVNLGSATIQSASDVLSTDPAFNGFLDYAFSNPSGYALGTGHPIANLTHAGVPSFGSGISQFAINMACFDETGNQAAGPVSSVNCITLQLHGTGTTTVTLDSDVLRSNTMLVGGQSTNLPNNLQVTLP